MENLKRYNQTKEDEMLNRHTLERRRLPKILKSEAKTRALMFKQSLRLSIIGTPEDDKTKIKLVSFFTVNCVLATTVNAANKISVSFLFSLK